MTSARYIKNIIELIVNEECKNRNLDRKKLSLISTTVVEYYKLKFMNRKFKLHHITDPLYYDGYYNPNLGRPEIVVFIKGIPIRTIISIIFTTYHELEHYNQYSGSNLLNLESFIIYMEQIIKSNNNNHYLLNHDQYMTEILANLSGVFKTKDFIDNNIIEGIRGDIDREYLNVLSNIYNYDYFNYNVFSTFDKFMEIYRKNKIKNLLPFSLSVFFNYDGTFKNIKEIVDNLDICNDIFIAYIVIASDTFRKEVDLSNLDDREVEIVNLANDYRKEKEIRIEENQKRFFKNNIKCKNRDNKKIYLNLKIDRLNRITKNNIKNMVRGTIDKIVK